MKNTIAGILALIMILTSCRQTPTNDYGIVEIVDLHYRLSNTQIVKICHDNGIEPTSVYEYRQHWVVFDQKSKTKQLSETLSEDYPSLCVKDYDTPFYVFDREEDCMQSVKTKSNHIIMTASLVADTLKQREYMDYHMMQPDLFPEVVDGFCNAGFHKLLLYRSGRQLMLVISIPEDKKLAEINHLTTENNPRVQVWNELMSQYQEGIEDAPDGQVWITFEKIKL
jgi:L-rhamnose mutarotase